jgi:toxin ParE1/3/4
MKVVYAESARRDISQIFEAIATHSPSAAQRVENVIRSQCERLTGFPYAAAKTDEPYLFRLPIVRVPYTIFYRVNLAMDRIEIARVLHGARITNLQSLPDD